MLATSRSIFRKGQFFHLGAHKIGEFLSSCRYSQLARPHIMRVEMGGGQYHKHKGPKVEQTHPIHNNNIDFKKVNRISETVANTNTTDKLN